MRLHSLSLWRFAIIIWPALSLICLEADALAAPKLSADSQRKKSPVVPPQQRTRDGKSGATGSNNVAQTRFYSNLKKVFINAQTDIGVTKKTLKGKLTEKQITALTSSVVDQQNLIFSAQAESKTAGYKTGSRLGRLLSEASQRQGDALKLSTKIDSSGKPETEQRFLDDILKLQMGAQRDLKQALPLGKPLA